MDPIGQVNPVLDALRKQLAENIERLRQAGKLGAAGGAARAAQPRGAAEGLDSVLRRRLGPLDRRSPEGLAAATRTFVETVLVAEFGEGLVSDPAFGDMLADLSASLREDADLREQLDRMLSAL